MRRGCWQQCSTRDTILSIYLLQEAFAKAYAWQQQQQATDMAAPDASQPGPGPDEQQTQQQEPLVAKQPTPNGSSLSNTE